jgi:DNA-binding transcriptional regulator YdaS (Cro superfamily)
MVTTKKSKKNTSQKFVVAHRPVINKKLGLRGKLQFKILSDFFGGRPHLARVVGHGVTSVSEMASGRRLTSQELLLDIEKLTRGAMTAKSFLADSCTVGELMNSFLTPMLVIWKLDDWKKLAVFAENEVPRGAYQKLLKFLKIS